MINHKKILNIGRSVIKIERDSISQLIDRLDDNFTNAVDLIYNANSRLIVSGVGKSASIANKIAATLNSTGQPAVFLHAVDAIHGDIGNIQKDDLVICISKSGNTDEIKQFVSVVRKLGNKIIAICGNMNSFLSREADFVIDTTVEKEACPNNLAPTSSTTAQLVIGDALAICLLEIRDFSDEDFARFHPGGILGKRLHLKVSDIVDHRSRAQVFLLSPINDVILEISNKRLGATVVIEEGEIAGIITDGDLRRMLERIENVKDLCAKDIMSKNPKVISPNTLAKTALSIMEKNNINQLVVCDSQEYIGIIHIHDILKEGI